MSSIKLANNELAKPIKKTKLKTIEEVNEPDNVNDANVETFIIESEVDKFSVLFEKVSKRNTLKKKI